MHLVERKYDEAAFAALRAAGVKLLFARLLAARGIGVANLETYLAPAFRNLVPGDGLPGISEAAATILDALAAGRRIAVFGDYDCDGLCATAIMTRALRSVAAGLRHGEGDARQIVPFVPLRLGEGYGLGNASLARLFREAPDVSLIVTVDNGITASPQIEALNARGVEVVVTDHHLPGVELPPAKVVVNPKVAAPEALSELCGAAVAYFLANAIVRLARSRCNDETIARGIGAPLFILAGLATVTDIMPLTLQNRILVAEALRHFHHWAPIGLRELYSRAARNAGELGVRDFGFALGPRINAAGRLASGMEALNLLMCSEDDRETARDFAMRVDIYNTERRVVEQRMCDVAMSLVIPGASAQVISFSSEDKENVHPGVAGVVASRILDRLENPVPVCVLVDGKGSLRAPAPYNVRAALDAASTHLAAYGGHALAAGVTVKPGEIEVFRAAFADACAAQRSSMSLAEVGAKTIDFELKPSDLTLAFAEEISRLEPFGEGNPEPLFVLRSLVFSKNGVRTLGHTGAHLQFTFQQHAVPRAVWWGKGGEIERLRAESNLPHDILFSVGISDYGGRHVELVISDIFVSPES